MCIRDSLRSLSRSLSRDPKKTQDQDAEDARMYSTNNYRISQIELQNAPHVIHEESEEQDQGALLDDEGNEEHSEDLVEAAEAKLKDGELKESHH